ncbi:GRAM domain-containing protein [Algoriphagus aquimarinus]|uniref:GRAM domain-containing protein n=1 Tax=Algoriphagus aquimarinus TaxID=237018 RepID=UPI0030D8A896|tara:strand:+ start:186707 stop:187261 length:555 start_codon:yes stop_codon:yes gene_type:complete
MKTKINPINWRQKAGLVLLNGGLFMVLLVLSHYLWEGEFNDWYVLIFQGVFFGVFMAFGFPYVFGKIANRLGVSLGESIHPELLTSEEIATEGPANLLRGAEAVGGKLFLTNKRLIFKSHKLNIRTGQSNIPYETIIDIRARKTGKLIDNGLRIKTTDGSEFDFVVGERASWMEKLQEKINSTS